VPVVGLGGQRRDRKKEWKGVGGKATYSFTVRVTTGNNKSLMLPGLPEKCAKASQNFPPKGGSFTHLVLPFLMVDGLLTLLGFTFAQAEQDLEVSEDPGQKSRKMPDGLLP
jgi:hypothetical protein